MTTRDEFIDLLIAWKRAGLDCQDAFETNLGIPEALSALIEKRDDILDVFDEMAARIAELEEMVRAAVQRIEELTLAARIKELEENDG